MLRINSTFICLAVPSNLSVQISRRVFDPLNLGKWFNRAPAGNIGCALPSYEDTPSAIMSASILLTTAKCNAGKFGGTDDSGTSRYI